MAQASPFHCWINDALARLTAVSGVGYLAAAYTISRWLTRPTHATVAPPELPADITCEPTTCTSADGVELAGWIVTPPEPRATVALFHGLRYDRSQTIARIGMLVEAGYRCVAFDFRAHGASGGKRSSFGWHEAQDVAAVAQLIARRWPDHPAAALGLSMGSAAICFAAATTPVFRAFVLESLYHDLASAFRHRVGVGFPPWFGHFARGAVWVTERRLGVSIAAVTPADAIARLAPRPIMLLTGSDDPHAPPEDVARLFERCADPREMHLIQGAGHTDLVERGGARYRHLLLDFLDRHLADATSTR